MPEKGKDIIADKYISILKYIKSHGYRVIHVKYKKKDLAGTFDPNTQAICVDRRIKYSLEGCFILLHEYGHLLQSKESKFKEFMDFTNKEDYSDRKMGLVIEAEQDASRRAVRLLRKNWNIIYESDDLSEEGLKDYIKFWRKFYFKAKKGV